MGQQQVDLVEYIHFYNIESQHSGRIHYGKTPMETFLDSKHLAEEKTNKLLIFDYNLTYKNPCNVRSSINFYNLTSWID